MICHSIPYALDVDMSFESFRPRLIDLLTRFVNEYSSPYDAGQLFAVFHVRYAPDISQPPIIGQHPTAMAWDSLWDSTKLALHLLVSPHNENVSHAFPLPWKDLSLLEHLPHDTIVEQLAGI